MHHFTCLPLLHEKLQIIAAIKNKRFVTHRRGLTEWATPRPMTRYSVNDFCMSILISRGEIKRLHLITVILYNNMQSVDTEAVQVSWKFQLVGRTISIYTRELGCINKHTTYNLWKRQEKRHWLWSSVVTLTSLKDIAETSSFAVDRELDANTTTHTTKNGTDETRSSFLLDTITFRLESIE